MDNLVPSQNSETKKTVEKLTETQVKILVADYYAQYELHDWTFTTDTAKRRAGCCYHSRKQISLSIYYINAAPKEDVIDTILHEIAHALAGPGHGHDAYWKAVCVRIGARPVRCYDSEVIEMPKGKWRGICSACQKVFYRHKKPKRKMYHVSCGKNTALNFVCR